MMYHLTQDDIRVLKLALKHVIETAAREGWDGTLADQQFKQMQTDLNDQAPEVKI